MSGIDEAALAQMEEKLRLEYARPGRAYHNETHLDDCLDKQERVEGLSARDLLLFGLLAVARRRL